MTTAKDLCNFNFLVFKNRDYLYVRAYRNVWVPKVVDENGKVLKKAHSAPKEQHQVGALLPSGKVKISPKFLEKYPEFAGIDWYFFDNNLVDEETYYDNVPNPVEIASQQGPDESAESDNDDTSDEIDEENMRLPAFDCKNFLPYYALSGLIYSTGMLGALKTAFGKEAGNKWRDLVTYRTLTNGPACEFEYWAQDQYLPPSSAKMDGREISRLLQGCTQEAWDNFWKKRFEWSQEQAKKATGTRTVRFCAFDSTSISTYGVLEEAAYGHAKQDPHLKQINLAMIVDQLTGATVYAFVYEGSINDKASYEHIHDRMEAAGFPMSEIMLITDRGYYSSYNANHMLNDGAHYLSAVPIAPGSSEEKWILNQNPSSLRNPLYFDYVNNVTHFTLTETWSLPNQPIKHTYTHIIYDPAIGEESIFHLNRMLASTLDSLKKGIHVDSQQMANAKPYLRQIPDPNGNPHMVVKKVWAFDNASIERHHQRAGFYVLKSDVVDDPVAAVTLYRMREIIEQGFLQIKCGVDGNRLRVQERAFLGKVLLYVLSAALRMAIRFNADMHKERVPNSKLSIPNNSVNSLLAKLNRIKVRRASHKHKWLVDMIPKEMRDMLKYYFLTSRPPKSF